MKRFLSLVLIGFMVFLPISLFLEFYQAKRVNMFSYKRDYMDKNAESIKTLLLGNSYMENSINPHLMGDSVFDLAISGRWIYYDVKLLEKYVSKMPHLQQVVFGMGYAQPFFGSYHFPEEKKWLADHLKYCYEKYMDIRYDAFPYYYWFGLINGEISFSTLRDDDEFLRHDSLEYIGYSPTEGQDGPDWKSLQNVDPNVISNPHSREQIDEYTFYLKELARICQDNGVRLIVVTPPCYDSYVANVRQEGVVIIHGMIERVQSEYAVEYMDYLQDKEFRSDSIYFNSSHLNSIGADMFALRVKKDFGLQ